MALNFKWLSIIFLFLFGINSAFAQYGFTNEIGVVVGPVAFQSDFGERKNLETDAGNTGIGFGIVHYINFNYRRAYSLNNLTDFFNEHFKVRNEISFNTTKLNHFGKYVAEAKTGINADKLRGHSGKANNFNIGTSLEFFPLNIRAFEAFDDIFAPYVSFGVQYTNFNPTYDTTYGDENKNNINNFYGPWVNALDASNPDDTFLFDGSGSTLALTGGVGTRIKFDILHDIVIDLKWQYFLNDKVDGLDHDLPSNKFNDWLVWLNVGYIFYLNNN